MSDRPSDETTDAPRGLGCNAVVSHDAWFPWWKKPVLWSEWQQLESQALRSCQMTGETYRDAKETKMPQWFVEKVARNWFRAKRRYFRVKRSNESRKQRVLLFLLREIGCG